MKKLYLLILVLLFLPLVSSLDTYQVSTNISIEHPVRFNGSPAPSAVCNITVLNPTPEIVVDYLQMTSSSSTHNYTVLDTDTVEVGIYNYYITCVSTQGNATLSDQFEVTYTGKAMAGTGFIVVFSIIFIILSTSLLYFFLHSIAKGGKLEYDLRDLSFSWGFLFGLLAMYLIFNSYWGDLAIGGILLWVIQIATITNGFIPLILFFVSLIFGTIKKRAMPDIFGGKR